MVASAVKPSISEVYQTLCSFLRSNAKLAVAVVNHIAAKHQIHSLPAFHSSDAIPVDDKLATYGELVRALVAHNGGDKNALGTLKGQVANGQAILPVAEPAIRLSDAEPTAVPEPARMEAPPPKTIPPAERPVRASDLLTDRLRELLVELIGEMPSSSVDEEQVKKIAETMLEEHADAMTTNVSKIVDEAIKAAVAAIKPPEPIIVRHEFKVGEGINVLDGLMHRQIPQIVAWLTAGVPVWLWGSAGASKTHSARQIAQAMGLPFFCAPIDETITVGKLVGFRNVSNGEFVEGLIYKAYKFGGVMLLDEGDTNAATLAATNSLFANDHYTFPNGEEVPRYANFRLILGANTKGTGAVAGYTARVRLDAATLDRFAVIKMEYDNGLELAICCGGPNTSTPWTRGEPASEALCRKYVEWVQRVRAKVGDSVLISPRASMLGVRALRVGISPQDVADALVFKLVTDDTRKRIINEAGNVPTS